MAGRNRNHAPHGGPAPMFPPLGPPPMVSPLLGAPPTQGGVVSDSPTILEQKLVTKHAEMQGLLMENQRFAATQVALREELAAAQQEIQRMQEMFGRMESEKDQIIRELVGKTGMMEADLRAMEPLRIDLERLSKERQELLAQIRHLAQESQRAHADCQQIPALKKEVDAVNEELQLARLAFEQERKASAGLAEQKQAMEKNLVSLAREVEKLRVDLASAEKRAHAAISGAGTATYYNSIPQNAHGNAYPVQQVGGPEPKSGPEGSRFLASSASGTQLEKPSAEVQGSGGAPKHSLSQIPQPGRGQWQGQQPPWTNQPSAAPKPSDPTKSSPANASLSPKVPNQMIPTHGSQGVNFLVHGVPDDFNDRMLAEVFLPFGPVLYAKILIDKETGRQSESGFITMDSPQAAEAAANAVNGMQISGKRLRIELDRRELEAHYRQQQLVQAQAAAGGGGPVRWHHRNEFPGARPY